MEEKTKNPIQVADRLFLTLETLAETGPIALADLQSRLQLNKSTVHRLLTSLIYLGYVRQDAETGLYSLSFKILSLSNRLLEKLDIIDTIRPHLKKLAEETGETVHFVQLDGTEAVYIEKEESYQNSVRMVSKIGSRVPLYCSGVGKAILADLPEDKIRSIWNASDIRALTKYTITEFPQFMKHLEQVRANGYALDWEENELGVRCIAVSIPRYDKMPRYALSISAPAARMSEEDIQKWIPVMLNIKKQLLSILT
ncbi:MAG: IclR family transcriptional regulator [Lachnospiraceae bacterium]|jgi:DNA-binding IclR family transcriptional regulator